LTGHQRAPGLNSISPNRVRMQRWRRSAVNLAGCRHKKTKEHASRARFLQDELRSIEGALFLPPPSSSPRQPFLPRGPPVEPNGPPRRPLTSMAFSWKAPAELRFSKSVLQRLPVKLFGSAGASPSLCCARTGEFCPQRKPCRTLLCRHRSQSSSKSLLREKCRHQNRRRPLLPSRFLGDALLRGRPGADRALG